MYMLACVLMFNPLHITHTQGYVVCPSEKRFLLLFTFLKKNMKKKVMVFLSSCNSVKFHAELLNYVDIPVMDIHVSGPGEGGVWRGGEGRVCGGEGGACVWSVSLCKRECGDRDGV